MTPKKNIPAKTVRYEWVALADWKYDERINQRLKPATVRWLIDHFNPAAINVPVLSERENGDRIVIAGQHRGHAMCSDEVGWADQKVYCEIRTGLTVEEEADLSIKLNHVNKTAKLEIFRLSVSAGNIQDRQIHNIVDDIGMRISSGGSAKNISSIASLRFVYDGALEEEGEHPKELAQTLAVLKDAWGYDKDTWKGELIKGVGALIVRQKKQLDPARLSMRLAHFAGGGRGFLAHCKGVAGYRKGKVWITVAEEAIKEYNKGLRAGQKKLTAW